MVGKSLVFALLHFIPLIAAAPPPSDKVKGMNDIWKNEDQRYWVTSAPPRARPRSGQSSRGGQGQGFFESVGVYLDDTVSSLGTGFGDDPYQQQQHSSNYGYGGGSGYGSGSSASASGARRLDETVYYDEYGNEVPRQLPPPGEAAARAAMSRAPAQPSRRPTRKSNSQPGCFGCF